MIMKNCDGNNSHTSDDDDSDNDDNDDDDYDENGIKIDETNSNFYKT